MKKKLYLVGLICLPLGLSGCTSVENVSKEVKGISTKVIKKISYYFESDSETNQVDSAVSQELQKKEDQLKEENVPATVDNMLLQISADGHNDYGQVFYKVIITNIAKTKIEVDEKLFNLREYSSDGALDIDFPSKKTAKKMIEPGEKLVLDKVLGPVSPDAPGYYYLAASYQKKVFWTQEPYMDDFK